jgi:hypothetical protein
MPITRLTGKKKVHQSWDACNSRDKITAGTPTTIETPPTVSVGTPPTAIKVATDRDTKL